MRRALEYILTTLHLVADRAVAISRRSSTPSIGLALLGRIAQGPLRGRIHAIVNGEASTDGGLAVHQGDAGYPEGKDEGEGVFPLTLSHLTTTLCFHIGLVSQPETTR